MKQEECLNKLMRQFFYGQQMSIKYVYGAIEGFKMVKKLLEMDSSVTPEIIEEGQKRVTEFETLEESSGFADATVFLMDNIGKWN